MGGYSIYAGKLIHRILHGLPSVLTYNTENTDVTDGDYRIDKTVEAKFPNVLPETNLYVGLSFEPPKWNVAANNFGIREPWLHRTGASGVEATGYKRAPVNIGARTLKVDPAWTAGGDVGPSASSSDWECPFSSGLMTKYNNGTGSTYVYDKAAFVWNDENISFGPSIGGWSPRGTTTLDTIKGFFVCTERWVEVDVSNLPSEPQGGWPSGQEPDPRQSIILWYGEIKSDHYQAIENDHLAVFPEFTLTNILKASDVTSLT